MSEDVVQCLLMSVSVGVGRGSSDILRHNKTLTNMCRYDTTICAGRKMSGNVGLEMKQHMAKTDVLRH